MKDIKFTGVKSAVGDFNRWTGAATVVLDRGTGEIWTNIFADGGDDVIYRRADVVELTAKRSLVHDWDKTSTRAVLELATAAMAGEVIA